MFPTSITESCVGITLGSHDHHVISLYRTYIDRGSLEAFTEVVQPQGLKHDFNLVELCYISMCMMVAHERER